MSEFWESSFKDNHEMWGLDAVDSARKTLEIFSASGYNSILIPGYGYGRNAKIFTDNGMRVTGIEISKTAIELSKKNYGEDVKVYHGSVNLMPFDSEFYDGVYCYSLIHLLDDNERANLIKNCYNQLSDNGAMVFISISKSDPRFGKGVEVCKDTFDMPYGVRLFFYDLSSIALEFANYGLIEAVEISETAINAHGKFELKFWQITCRKL